jgi:molybdopterin-guanine dinucleotide biosynthesis protein A
MAAPTPVIGLILAGGRATRMGGRDKALVALHGEPLLQHLARRLRPQVDDLAINSNADPANYAGFRLPVIADLLPDFPGPLAGLHAGLARYPDNLVLAVSVDTPFIPDDLATRLQAGLGDQPCAVASDGTHHALALLCRPGLAETVREHLDTGGRRVGDFLDRYAATIVFDQPRDRGLFMNLNTPDDLARVEREYFHR